MAKGALFGHDYGATYVVSEGDYTFVVDSTYTQGLGGKYTMPALAGVFIETGRAALFRRAWTLSGSKATYTFTGVAATLREHHALTITRGEFTLTGQAARLLPLKIFAGTGSFALTGGFLWKRLMAQPGTFHFTGSSTIIKVVADKGSFAWAGGSAAFLDRKRIIAKVGAYQCYGGYPHLRALRFIYPAGHAFTLTGEPVGLRRTFTLRAEKASFSMVRWGAGLRATRRLSCAARGFTLTGRSALFHVHRWLRPTVTPFTLTGEPAGAVFARRLKAAPHAFHAVGGAASLRVARVLQSDAGAIVLTGQDAALGRRWRLGCEPGHYLLTGQDVLRGLVLSNSAGVFVLRGGSADLVAGWGGDAEFTISVPLTEASVLAQAEADVSVQSVVSQFEWSI